MVINPVPSRSFVFYFAQYFLWYQLKSCSDYLISPAIGPIGATDRGGSSSPIHASSLYCYAAMAASRLVFTYISSYTLSQQVLEVEISLIPPLILRKV